MVRGSQGDEIVQATGLDMVSLLQRDAADLAELASRSPAERLGDVTLLPPVPRPGKLIAVAANYQDHIKESGLAPVDKSRRVPRLFIKPITSLLAPGQALALPEDLSAKVDWELELAVVIGRGGKDIPEGEALQRVGGYAIINDVSARSLEWHVQRAEDPWNAFFDWLNGKWLDGFAPMGPWLVTADEVPDPQGLRIRLKVNDAVMQDASTADMIFSVAELVAFASRLMTLQPGDVIATGTPAGVGDAAGTYLKPGDEMVGTIDGLGTLVTPVVGPGGAPGKLLSTMYNSADAGDRGGVGDRNGV